MRFTSVLLLASSALAAIVPVRLVAHSDNDEINGMGISSIHEGAGINYMFLASQGQELQYDDGARVLFIQPTPELRQYFAIDGGIVQMTVAAQPLAVSFGDDGAAIFDGDATIYAQKNINDPYRYSETSFFLVSHPEGAPEGAIPLRIFRADGGEPPAPESSPEPTPQPTPEPTPEVSPRPPANDTTISSFEGSGALVKGSFGAVAALAVGLLL